MIKKTFPCLVLAITVSLSGCMTTFEKPRTFDQLGHFSSYPLNQSTFRVSFKTSPNMSYGTAQEITLLKAAQIAVQNGFGAFKVLNDPSNRNQPPRQTVVYPAPPPMFGGPYGFYRPGPGFGYGPWNEFPEVVNLDPTEVSYTIECYKEPENTPKDAFNAGLILQSLGAKYGVAPNGQVLPPIQPPQRHAPPK
ncbi:hypothetical protein I2F29_07950 [Acinetobacter sp. FNA3]|jgi:hypothetical protein|uniref:DUF4136 domain-containing protein n=1 Tax=Acinetobacter pollinis TaxID=2605270 RepID=A0ABU6DTJ4_9GAMM|nr:hypothetical protein [Acinetobacter pollinis]MBF7693329.1 hypothetical protein [Acinetobacter pollinis]MBF7701530.1 hypothetical protein [Acinetobacter pollinis]MEB5477163.1 hypothetical protein [Acinetobacter pollinis]